MSNSGKVNVVVVRVWWLWVFLESGLDWPPSLSKVHFLVYIRSLNTPFECHCAWKFQDNIELKFVSPSWVQEKIMVSNFVLMWCLHVSLLFSELIGCSSYFNDYPADQIQRIIRKHEDTTSRRNLTSLSSLDSRRGNEFQFHIILTFSSTMTFKWWD
jgi:hypothetical protein